MGGVNAGWEQQVAAEHLLELHQNCVRYECGGDNANVTRVDVNARLIEQARRVGGYKTSREVVTVALQEFVKRRQQLRIVDLLGRIPYESEYDYKAERKRRRH